MKDLAIVILSNTKFINMNEKEKEDTVKLYLKSYYELTELINKLEKKDKKTKEK